MSSEEIKEHYRQMQKKSTESYLSKPKEERKPRGFGSLTKKQRRENAKRASEVRWGNETAK